MDTQELYRRGLAIRKEIFGKEAVDKRMAAVGDYGAPLQNIVNAYAYGDIWARPGMARKMRSLVVLAMTAAIIGNFSCLCSHGVSNITSAQPNTASKRSGRPPQRSWQEAVRNPAPMQPISVAT